MKGNEEPPLATLHPRKKLWPRPKTSLMSWYNYFFCFFAGTFLANVVPHFVHGISGDRFPTPCADPPGKGLSSPTANVVWALVNLIVGYVLFRVGKVSSGGNLALAIFFAGIAALSMWLSVLFAKIKRPIAFQEK